MTITKNLDGTKLTIALEGRLDTTTSPQLEAEMHSNCLHICLHLIISGNPAACFMVRSGQSIAFGAAEE